jgi:hypothetical protein
MFITVIYKMLIGYRFDQAFNFASRAALFLADFLVAISEPFLWDVD